MQPVYNLVNIHALDPSIYLDLRYATPHNFCQTVLYPVAHCFLHKDAADALVRVQEKLRRQGLSLKIFDGYRPLSVQQHMWDLIQDENYVANPAKNKGRHTRGTAVDVTLVDLHGNELEMPSPFDDFTQRAHRNNPAHSKNALKHMQLLEQSMQTEGFEGWPLEWWHYDLKGWQDDNNYPSLDISLLELH